MQSKHLARPVFSLGLALLLAGCGGNRESKLIGSWKARPVCAMLNGIQSQANGASTQEAVDTAKMMAASTLDIRADKTFSLNFSAPMEGTWTWSEDTGTAKLTASLSHGEESGQSSPTPVPPPSFKAKLSDDNSRLTLSNSLPSANGGIELNFDKS